MKKTTISALITLLWFIGKMIGAIISMYICQNGCKILRSVQVINTHALAGAILAILGGAGITFFFGGFYDSLRKS